MGELTTIKTEVLRYETMRNVRLSDLPQDVLVRSVTESPDVPSISGRVEAMLGHYFKEKQTRADWDHILDDWIDILCQLPYWAIEYACLRWMREDRRKPTPHDIYNMASQEVLRYRDELNRRHDAATASPEPVALTDAEKAHRVKVSEAVMKKFPKGSAVNAATKMRHWADGLSVEEQEFASWMGGGDTGISSESIAISAMGGDKPKRWGWGYPHDPADFGRCARLLRKHPEIREKAFSRLKSQGPVHWSRLIDRWDEIEAEMDKEVGIDWSKGKNAENTYNLIRSIIRPKHVTPNAVQP